MELRSGYKPTAVGVIPQQWEVKKLGEIGRFRKGRTISKAHLSRVGRPCVLYGEIYTTYNHVVHELLSHIPDEVAQQSTRIQPGDILFAGSGETAEEIGKCFAYVGAEDAYAGGDLVVLSPQEHDSIFLGYQLNSPPVCRQKANLGQGSSVVHIYASGLSTIDVAIPPLAEQRAIGAVLCNVDALIAALDQLIAKKRAIKRGAMQQLLTGKTRLHGFSGAWEMKTLGDVGTVSGAGVDKKIRPGEVPVRLVNYLDVYRKEFIHSGDLEQVVTAPALQASRCAVHRGDVFFTPSSEVRGDIGHSAVAVEDIPDAAYSYHVVRLRLHEEWDVLFRAYAFKSNHFYSQARTLCDGSGTRYVISLGKFRSIGVFVPPIAEQQAIAAVLSDMDAEICALEERREKTRALKKGMMQELLTGRTRLI